MKLDSFAVDLADARAELYTYGVRRVGKKLLVRKLQDVMRRKASKLNKHAGALGGKKYLMKQTRFPNPHVTDDDIFKDEFEH